MPESEAERTHAEMLGAMECERGDEDGDGDLVAPLQRVGEEIAEKDVGEDDVDAGGEDEGGEGGDDGGEDAFRERGARRGRHRQRVLPVAPGSLRGRAWLPGAGW
ncbi:MAG: hypothetical protein M0002_03700 [Rhodospirillales bacterium]|nr:hypothetical protein [Rhodospirillales bacterium]